MKTEYGSFYCVICEKLVSNEDIEGNGHWVYEEGIKRFCFPENHDMECE